MRRSPATATLVWLVLAATPATAEPARVCAALEGFSSSKPGEFPTGWRPESSSGRAIYRVLSDGTLRFLRAHAHDQGVAAMRAAPWDLSRFPVLCWRWRPRVFPTRACESERGRSDSVLAVYVGFRRKWGALKYLWSERLTVGTELDHAPFGRTKLRVVGSGVPADRDRWVDVCVDVAADYRRRYGERDAGWTDGIGVMSDADDTDSDAEGDYADFRVCTR